MSRGLWAVSTSNSHVVEGINLGGADTAEPGPFRPWCAQTRYRARTESPGHEEPRTPTLSRAVHRAAPTWPSRAGLAAGTPDPDTEHARVVQVQ
jgi:hypothetical protein